MRSFLAIVAAGLVSSAGAACGSPALDLRVEAAVDDALPSVVHVRWEAAEPVVGRVAWLPEGADDWSLADWSEPVRASEQSILALHPDQSVLVRVEVQQDGQVGEAGDEVEVAIPEAPRELPRVAVGGTGELEEGFVLTHVLTSEANPVVVYDRQGEPVWYLVPTSGRRVLDALADADGRSLWFVEQAMSYTETMGAVHRVALDGSYHDVFDVDRAHSALAPLPEGGFGVLAKQYVDYEDGRALYDEIWEVDGDGDAAMVFSLADHFDPEPYCECFTIGYAEMEPDGNTWYDWTHANSLMLSEDGQAWYVLVRNIDGLVKVDRATGNLEWVLGGRFDEFAFDDDTNMFNHGHMTQLGQGGMTVFDNGVHRDPPASRVVRYAVDEQARQVRTEWMYFGPEEMSVAALGDADLLDDGDRLVSWTTEGVIEQVSPADESRWDLSFELGAFTGRVQLLDTLQ